MKQRASEDIFFKEQTYLYSDAGYRAEKDELSWLISENYLFINFRNTVR